MASRTALGSDSNSLTSTSPENLEAFPPSEYSDSSRPWVFSQGLGLWERGRGLLCFFRFCCTVIFVLWLLLLLRPAFLLLSHLAFPKASYRCQRIPESQECPSSVRCIYQVFLKMSATHYLKIKGNLAWPAVHVISYPTPRLIIAPHPAD